MVLRRLNDHMKFNNLNVPEQPAYKKDHSTGTQAWILWEILCGGGGGVKCRRSSSSMGLGVQSPRGRAHSRGLGVYSNFLSGILLFSCSLNLLSTTERSSPHVSCF